MSKQNHVCTEEFYLELMKATQLGVELLHLFNCLISFRIFTYLIKKRMSQDNNTKVPYFQHFATNLLHEGQDPDQWNFKAVVPPISLSTTFKQDTPGEYRVMILISIFSFWLARLSGFEFVIDLV